MWCGKDVVKTFCFPTNSLRFLVQKTGAFGAEFVRPPTTPLSQLVNRGINTPCFPTNNIRVLLQFSVIPAVFPLPHHLGPTVRGEPLREGARRYQQPPPRPVEACTRGQQLFFVQSLHSACVWPSALEQELTSNDDRAWWCWQACNPPARFERSVAHCTCS